MVSPSLSRSSNLPSRSSNTEISALAPGLQRADGALVAHDLRRRRRRPPHDLIQRHAEMQQFRHGRGQVPDRPARRAGHRQVGRDRVGQETLVQRLLDHAEVEMVPPMRAIEDDAGALRLDHFLQQELLLLPHDAVRAAVIAVRDDVARLHMLDQVGQRDRRVGDVHHHRHAAGHLGRFARQLHRLGRIFPDQPRAEAQLHADRQIGVFDDGARAALGIGVGKMRQLAAARRAGDADRRQVDERTNARVRTS